ncbi:hypothetical protein B7P43_G08180 [Cryptotermes secundus]|uniref:Uncharacterized protein n=1 Tax=Cryptotermes secundus TaxID=105785 RepID=A0A2J7RI34_9NEOP|nr:hypothetical protein B7P43_G08180 [Cryptotermes secundus]
MPDSLGNWHSYRLPTPATALHKQMFSSNIATSSNGRSAASQLTQPPQHTTTNILFLPARAVLLHRPNIPAANGPFQGLQTFPKECVVIGVMTKPHRSFSSLCNRFCM